ncbi:spermatogenesis associated 2-like [Stegastes partitus]|uniref:Spermatogenesis associated 2 like n=1 Tax=Stegastes partitus TaxID=144197 RepID=A0A3B5BDU0_9TELE|nr:PREDICTED: spermatogenesis-associated protein 2-like protein [Stegastes partitus]XP_008291796.1 PREDICTED: spermatogenesis-associated protein 2-like protein [Stegastes partitus]
MSASRQRARDLVGVYDLSLERQIVGGGCSLALRDEDLWRQVEELLRAGDAQETHCLGLDPLRVMEESLKAAASGGRRPRARGGLRGLAKAFEVLEQAALNLYLGPWRDEYRVIKMYSGLFTHHIAPVLSPPQIQKLFGLLGYQLNPARPEQLRLHPARTGAGSLDDLLRLSCAFFVARCECRLLLAALGKHDGDVQWELSLVRERQQGGSLQAALDATQRTLEAEQPLMEPFDRDVDLYQDEQVNGQQQQPVAADDCGPHSVTWTTPSSASPPTAGTHSNGATSPPPEPEASWSSIVSRRPSRRPGPESRFDAADSPLPEATEADQLCSCLQAPHLGLRRCIECDALHDASCASLEVCRMSSHSVTFSGEAAGAASPQRASPTVMASLTLHDEPTAPSPALQPISYHDCCDLTRLNPELLCRSCSVFHAGSCREGSLCQAGHDVQPLGVCSCGRLCSRRPLVLCRYCGNEYCNPCWYRNPVSCSCGQTFDQSTSV